MSREILNVKGEWRSRGDLIPIVSKSIGSCYTNRLTLLSSLGPRPWPSPLAPESAARMNFVISLLIRVIEAMFVAGILGSAIVVLLTSIEDFKMLFEKEPSSNSAKNM
jgi:hypothetical protein